MEALEAVKDAERTLIEARVASPRADAELLVAHVLRATRSSLYAGDSALSEGDVRELGRLLARRTRREPLAYVLGEWGFRRLTLAVDPRVLVPRPETEVVVDRCLELVADLAAPRVVDIGVGSGAIALALADEHPGVRVVGVDASEDALAVARANAGRLGLADRVDLRAGDLLGDVTGPVDLVVSNPPYVRRHEIDALEPEVRDHEPRLALVGEDIAETVAAAALEVLRPGGSVVLECGDDHATTLAHALERIGYVDVRLTRDLNGIERVVDGRRPGSR